MKVECPAMERCLDLVAEGGTCAKYDRPCANAAGCRAWGYECDNRYNDVEGYR